MRGDEQGTIDERIDAALRRYAEAPHFSEPRVALARVRALREQQERRWNSWVWIVPPSVIAIVIAVVVLWAVRIPRTPQIAWVPKAPGVAEIAPQGLKPALLAESNGTTKVMPFQNTAHSTRDANRCCADRHGEAIRTVAQDEARALPKQEVFPTPQPLSPQERALVSFVSQAPPAVKEQVLAAQKQIDASIEIADIQIRPLDYSSEEPQTKGKDLP